MLSVGLVALLSLVPSIAAQGSAWSQCGGNGWTGAKTCVSGTTCSFINEWYSQCVPGSAPPVTSSTKVISSVVATSTIASSSARPTTSAPPTPRGVNYWFSFGDSYTQTGFNPAGPQPAIDNPLGNPPYPGWTSTGGPNWVDYLALSYNKSVLLTYNYASGGATTDADLVTPWQPTGILSLVDQVAQFFATIGSTPWKGANSLFSVFIGINDIGNSFYLPGDRAAFSDVLLNAQFALYQQIYDAGGRNFAFVNIPPIDRSPAMIRSGAASQALEKSVILTHNAKLAAKAAAFKASHPGVQTYIIDFWTSFTKILDAPTAYGFVDATSFGGPRSFWGDDYHPAATGHKFLGQDAAKALASTIF